MYIIANKYGGTTYMHVVLQHSLSLQYYYTGVPNVNVATCYEYVCV